MPLPECNFRLQHINPALAGFFIRTDYRYFWTQTIIAMRTIYIILFFAAAFMALYEQSKPQSNLFIMGACIVVFIIGLMRLMSKVPSKNQSDNNENLDEEV